MPDETVNRYRLPGFPFVIMAMRALKMARRPGNSPREMTVDGLSGSVVVERDPFGVPRVMANNMTDVLYAQGYLHGRERGFQMDLTRRLGYGELAELLGPAALPSDRLMRTLNFRKWCQESIATWSENTNGYVAAYVKGVNQAWQEFQESNEWRIFRVKPRPWTMADCSIMQFLLGWMLNSIWTAKWGRHLLADDREVLEWLFGPLSRPSPTIFPETGPAFPWGDRGFGSNNWVVGGRLSQSGSPLLANDPHLAPGLPSPWYLMVLEGGMLHTFGATLPGAPGVILGQNQEIAWGLTNLDADVQDLFAIQLEADGEHYRLEDRQEQLHVRQEVLAVRHQAPQTLTCWDSHWGPVLFRPEPNAAIAIRWSGFQPQPGVQSVLRLNRAADWETFNLALAEWWTPAQNFVYADRSGHIGYVAAGKFLLPPEHPADLYDGNNPHSAPRDFLDWQQNPRLFDPPEGYIVTANNPVAGDGHPVSIPGRHNLGFRAEQIVSRIRRDSPHTWQTMAAIQMDVFSSPLLSLCHRLCASDLLPDAWKVHLQPFDGRVETSAIAPTLLYAFAMEALPERLKQRLNQPFLPSLAHEGMAVPPNLWVLLGERLIPLVLQNWEPISIPEATRQAIRRLSAALGPDMARWQWGRAHQAKLFHPLAESRMFAPVFGRMPLPLPGDWYTPMQSAFSVNPEDPWPRTAAVMPGYRQILDLARPERSRAILIPGQSGDPGFPHSDDMIEEFLGGRYHPLGPGMDTEMWFTLHPASRRDP